MENSTSPTAPARFPPGPLRLEQLTEALAADGLINSEQRNTLIKLAPIRANSRQHPVDFVAAQRFEQPGDGTVLDTAALLRWLSDYCGLPVHTVDPLKVDVAAVTEMVSYSYAERHGILAVAVTNARVTFATSEPFETGWVEELARLLQRDIERVLLAPSELKRFALEFYSLAKSVKGARQEKRDAAPSVHNLEQLMELGRKGNLDANDRHVVSIVDWLLQYAFDQRASDIHMEPRRDNLSVRFRIDGVLHSVYDMPDTVGLAVTSRLKILGRMDVSEKRKPQDGRIKTRDAAEKEIELRLSTMPTVFGEKLVMRVFNPEVVSRDLSALGMSREESAAWRSMLERPHGIVLVTGPTGSGKTSTLYTSLKLLATPDVNVCTVEDPIELVEPAFNQMQVQPSIGVDFAAGVRTLLRQDPDVIMVGEIRDAETAMMAVQAALTGHLVLSTLHTNDAPSAVVRLAEFGIPHYLINATLVGVMAQRLVRTLCPHCKTPSSVEPDVWTGLLDPWKAKLPTRAHRPAGCLECRNTGFTGRVGIHEMLVLDDALRALVRDGADVDTLRKRAYANGMRPMRVGGAAKVAEGLTTVEEVLKVAPSAF
ncbi:MAG: GspE/PulE family protein [Pseudomonadota bacterium]